MAPAKKKACAHQTICIGPSEFGRKTAGFERVPAEKRIAATTRSGTVSDASGPGPDATTFPGPLVLPDDKLALNHRYLPQSLRSWIHGKYRNPITLGRKTLYIADVPPIDESAAFMKDWAEPDVEDLVDPEEFPKLEHPETRDLIKYLGAFYHPLPVKLLPTPLKFVGWEGAKMVSGRPSMVGLLAGDKTFGIRARPSPDEIARMQLNLKDLLDALRSILPKDAYASVMVTEQDLYEDEDDDFCCGRAFGGSRISVVSSFRYRPVLDLAFGVVVDHMWPLSHCARFVEGFCEQHVAESGEEEGKKRKRGGRKTNATDDEEFILDLKKRRGTAIGAAINASKKGCEDGGT
ncbi:hypothetical protein EsH8_X_000211 [Colletotrichum jinshuiense]